MSEVLLQYSGLQSEPFAALGKSEMDTSDIIAGWETRLSGKSLSFVASVVDVTITANQVHMKQQTELQFSTSWPERV